MLFRIYGCLVAHGKCLFRKWFSVDRVLGVNWFPFLFYLQIQFFGKQRERELSESEIEEEERGREHTPPASQALAREIAPRKRSNPERRAVRLRLRRSTSNCTLRLRRSMSPFNFTLRLCRSTSPFDFTPIANPDSSSSIANPDLSSLVAIVTPQNRSSSTPKPIVLLFLLLSIWPDYDFFFLLGFICVSELRDEIIYLFGRWENVFSVWFWFLLL